MAIEIVGGNSTNLVHVDSISNAARVTLYASDGHEGMHVAPEVLTIGNITEINGDLLPSTDVSNYKNISFQLTGSWVATVTIQGSNDNSNFVSVVSQNITTLTTPFSSTVTEPGIIKIPVLYKYLRIRVTDYTSGTLTGTAFGHTDFTTFSSVSQIGAVSLNAETTKVIGTVNIASTPNDIVGAITAADTAIVAPAGDGVLLTGTPSVNSYVVLQSDSQDSAWSIELTGVMGSSTFYFEGSTSSTDGINGSWAQLDAVQSGISSSTNIVTSTTTAGVFRGNAAGIKYIRIRAVTGVGINATVYIRLAGGTGLSSLNAPLPTGTNSIGTIGLNAGSNVVGNVGLETGSNVVGNVGLEAGSNVVGNVGLETGTNSIGSVGLNAGSSVIGNVGLETGTNSIGSVSLSAGTNIIGKVQIEPEAGTPQYQKFISTSGLNATSVKGSAAKLTILHIVNGAATLRYFKLYNLATAPTVGTDVPLITITLAPSSASNFTLPAFIGIDFSVGLSFAVTLGVADTDTTGFTVVGEVTAMLAYV